MNAVTIAHKLSAINDLLQKINNVTYISERHKFQCISESDVETLRNFFEIWL